VSYISYLLYVLRHRWFVFVECCQEGLLWRGLVHDASKFRPSEFFPYARFFGARQPRDKTGYYKPTDTGDAAFDRAWFWHQKRNRHHWQYWTIPTADGVVPLDIPDADLREMVCDWRGASRAQGATSTVQEWYAANGAKMVLTDATRLRLNALLDANPLESLRRGLKRNAECLNRRAR
jgi:hypothetical protein